MRIAVFGATGRTGRHVVAEALTRGHSVVGISRTASHHDGPAIPWHVADVLDPSAVRNAIRGADAVIVCLGPSSAEDTTCGRGTRIIVDVMRELGIERLACQTGAMIGHAPSRLSWILYRIRTAWRDRNRAQARDRDAQELALRASGLDTTIVRPSRLVPGPRTQALVSDRAFVSAMASSRYEDVAACLVDGVEGRVNPTPTHGVVVLSRPTLDAGFLARWTAAHSVGEMLGLGTVGLAAMLSRTWARGSFVGTLMLGAAAGLIEGFIVAGLLGMVLVALRPEVRMGSWLRRTILGATLCWGLGMLPAAIGHASGTNTDSARTMANAATDPPAWLMMLGAIGLGLVAGPILGAIQARALQPMGMRSRVWIAATSIGWAAGMPLVFVAAGDAWTSTIAVARGLWLLACAGGVVGLATGVALVWIDRVSHRRAGSGVSDRLTPDAIGPPERQAA